MAYTLDYDCPVERSVRPFCFTDKLLLTAGPCTVSPRVLQALAQPIEYPFDLVFDNVRNPKSITYSKYSLDF